MNFSAMHCVDIARHSSVRGRQTTVRWQKQAFIHTQLSRAYLVITRLSCFKCQQTCRKTKTTQKTASRRGDWIFSQNALSTVDVPPKADMHANWMTPMATVSL